MTDTTQTLKDKIERARMGIVSALEPISHVETPDGIYMTMDFQEVLSAFNAAASHAEAFVKQYERRTGGTNEGTNTGGDRC